MVNKAAGRLFSCWYSAKEGQGPMKTLEAKKKHKTSYPLLTLPVTSLIF